MSVPRNARRQTFSISWIPNPRRTVMTGSAFGPVEYDSAASRTTEAESRSMNEAYAIEYPMDRFLHELERADGARRHDLIIAWRGDSPTTISNWNPRRTFASYGWRARHDRRRPP